MPMEIENALTSHLAVLEVAVVGLPEEMKGEIPVGATVLDGLRGFLKNELADLEILRQFHFIEALPKNALNKVLKPRLVEMLQKA